MFTNLRIQLIEPCKAKCLWCGTWKKNPKFRELKRNGTLDKIVAFYKELIAFFKPEVLNISGGEPILYPKINSFLNDIAPFVQRINLFVSYQFGRTTRNRLDLENLPHDKLVLTHSTNGFNPDYWHHFTQGFPFDLYLENLKFFAKTPATKHYKIIANYGEHEAHEKKLRELVGNNEKILVTYKFINNQAGNYGARKISETKKNIVAILEKEEKLTNREVLRQVLVDDTLCPFKLKTEELRFAFFKGGESPKFKYRFCPYFPPENHFIFKIGRDSFEDILENFSKKRWHKWCENCRLKLYR